MHGIYIYSNICTHIYIYMYIYIYTYCIIHSKWVGSDLGCQCGARSHWNGSMMLHVVCCGEEAGARNRVFFRVKWLQPAMKGTSCVRRLRLGLFGSFYVFCKNGGSCVRSSMRFLTLRCQIALEWLHDVTCRVLWGGSRSTKPCVFPCKVAAAGDERYLVCATVAAGVVWFLLCVLQQCLFLCA